MRRLFLGAAYAALIATMSSRLVSAAPALPQTATATGKAEAIFFNLLTTWATDGTTAGTVALPIEPDAGYGILTIASPNQENLFPFRKKLMLVDTEFAPAENAYQYQIWTSDGTAAGTSKVTTTTVLDNALVAPLGSKALIYSTSTSGVGVKPTVQFVVTDGTKTGTTAFKVPGPPAPCAFSPGYFVSLGKRVIFPGTATNGTTTLWSSDGTTTGTGPLKIAGVPTTAGNGLYPDNIVAVGAKAFFTGYHTGGTSSSGNEVLWVTDGTAAGTKEISIPKAGTYGLLPNWLTAAGGKLFFSGYDASFNSALWVTDGTTAGTHEITVSGAPGKGLSPSPGGVTAFGNKVIFTGLTANFNDGIFVSDGTTAGSFQLTFTGSNPEGFFAYGNKVLFSAFDSTGRQGLWIADGSRNGTHQIVVPKAYSQGIFSDIPFSGINSGVIGAFDKNFAIVGSDAVFYGVDSLGRKGLWITNGTAAGTHALRANLLISDLTSVNGGQAATTVRASPPAR